MRASSYQQSTFRPIILFSLIPKIKRDLKTGTTCGLYNLTIRSTVPCVPFQCCVLYYPRALRFANSWSTFFSANILSLEMKTRTRQLSLSTVLLWAGLFHVFWCNVCTLHRGLQPPGQALRATEPFFVRSFVVVVYVCLCVHGTATYSSTRGERTSLWQHVPSSSFPICYPNGRSLASVPERALCFIVPFALVFFYFLASFAWSCIFIW